MEDHFCVPYLGCLTQWLCGVAAAPTTSSTTLPTPRRWARASATSGPSPTGEPLETTVVSVAAPEGDGEGSDGPDAPPTTVEVVEPPIPDRVRRPVDAARLDGCGFFRIYWHIMLPLVRPTLAAIAIFTFLATWNEFMMPLIYLADQRLYYSSNSPAYVRSHTALRGLIQALAYGVYSRDTGRFEDRIKAFRLK